MAKKSLPCPTVVRQLLQYDEATGKLAWRVRPRWMFASKRSCSTWNTRYSGKDAFTAPDGYGYRFGSLFDTSVKAHRAVYAIVNGHWPTMQIDHINGDRSDNRIENLRDVSASENRKNTSLRDDNNSGVHGVSWDNKRQRWFVKIHINGKQKSLGRFLSFDDAVLARKDAEDLAGYHTNHGRY